MSSSYKGFKKVSEDKKQAVMEHPNGHRIIIAKSGLTGKLKKALKALPLHQSDSDSVVDPDADSNQPPQVNSMQDAAAQMFDSQPSPQGANIGLANSSYQGIGPQGTPSDSDANVQGLPPQAPKSEIDKAQEMEENANNLNA